MVRGLALVGILRAKRGYSDFMRRVGDGFLQSRGAGLARGPYAEAVCESLGS